MFDTYEIFPNTIIFNLYIFYNIYFTIFSSHMRVMASFIFWSWLHGSWLLLGNFSPLFYLDFELFRVLGFWDEGARKMASFGLGNGTFFINFFNNFNSIKCAPRRQLCLIQWSGKTLVIGHIVLEYLLLQRGLMGKFFWVWKFHGYHLRALFEEQGVPG